MYCFPLVRWLCFPLFICCVPTPEGTFVYIIYILSTWRYVLKSVCFFLLVCLFVWGLSSNSRILHSYGDVTIIGERLQIVSYTLQAYQLSSDGTLACNTYCNTGHTFILVISEDPWHSHLLPNFLQWSCHYLFLRLYICRGWDSNNQPSAVRKTWEKKTYFDCLNVFISSEAYYIFIMISFVYYFCKNNLHMTFMRLKYYSSQFLNTEDISKSMFSFTIYLSINVICSLKPFSECPVI